MEVGVPGRVLWELFVVLHAVFKKALPKNVDGNKVDLSTKNDITNIRHDFRAIPLILPDANLDKTKLDDPNFARSLHSLLEVLETMVSNDIRKDYKIQSPDFADPPEQFEYGQLQLRFINLMTMIGELRSINVTPELVTAPSKRQRETISKLAKYIDFVDLQKKRNYNSSEIVKSIREFRSAVHKLFQDPIESLEINLGNAAQLAHDETSFIEKAYRFSSLSRDLFNLLAGSVTCPGVHAAQLHLSGFLGLDASFEVLIADCRNEHWRSVRYRWVNDTMQSAERYRTEQIVCARRDQATPKHTCVAFDQEGMWDDETQDGEAYHTAISDRKLTLHELILPTHQEPSPVFKLKAQEKKTLELLIACSLFNLDASHWTRFGLGIDTISVRVAREASNLLLRCKPHINSALQTADDEDDENAAVLSFGLLIMEMEANRVANPIKEDENWGTDGISRDSILKRILGEWADDVEDDYKDIATSCLLFRPLAAKFYDPLLTQDMKRTGAIYKYILAPLFRLVIQKFRKSQDLFPGIPKSTYSRSASNDHNLRHPTPTSDMILFDGSEAALHTQHKIDQAKTFMENLDEFAYKIQQITETSPPPHWAPWRIHPIRIAILDTGIDSEDDMLVKTALEGGRIKECCGFVNNEGSDPDTADFQDANGHGTHVTRLILKAAPSAEIFIAKISEGTTASTNNLHRIAKAIEWAIEKKVNIISMSFGLDNQDIDIDKAIHAAMRANISMFAAASNSGGNKPRAYPSRRINGVLCIHASDGAGNDGGISPTPLKKRDNFSTLGISISSKWKRKPIYVSGTSFATPIAAALVANVLEFARHKCDLNEHQQEVLYHIDGVRQILTLMVEQGTETRGGYDYIMPFHLWTKNRSDSKVAEIITDITNS
ncbi:unnamed protein product [Penicillium pancosmium]